MYTAAIYYGEQREAPDRVMEWGTCSEAWMWALAIAIDGDAIEVSRDGKSIGRIRVLKRMDDWHEVEITDDGLLREQGGE